MIIKRHRKTATRRTEHIFDATACIETSCAKDSDGYRVTLLSSHHFTSAFTDRYWVTLTEAEIDQIVGRLKEFKKSGKADSPAMGVV